MINNIQLPIVICCSPRVHTFIGQDMMVPSVALWHRFARIPVAGKAVGFYQLVFLEWNVLGNCWLYFPEASTLGFSKGCRSTTLFATSAQFSVCILSS
ncbi:hypothetical protein Tco_1401793 [Tanacetum coccineum]